MHTLVTKNCRFHFNGDFSGMISAQPNCGKPFEVDFEDIKELAAEYIRRQRISKIEQATFDELVAAPMSETNEDKNNG